MTDLRDPANPLVSDEPIDLWRNDGYTDYSHDVDEDERGIAWVSGRGGIRGYATRGRHRDPYQNRWRRATPFDPVLVAGGGVGGTAQPVMFMHNAGRPTDGSVRAEGVARGNVLVGTEEDFTKPCGHSGRIVLSDLTDSLRRRARAAVDAGGAVPDAGARHVPPVPRHGRDGESGPRSARRTTSRSRARRSARPGTARACGCWTSPTPATCARWATTA